MEDNFNQPRLSCFCYCFRGVVTHFFFQTVPLFSFRCVGNGAGCKISSALDHLQPPCRGWRKNPGLEFDQLQLLILEVKRKTFVLHMGNANSEMRMVIKIQAACYFSIDKVIFLCWGMYWGQSFYPPLSSSCIVISSPWRNAWEEFTGMANSSWQMWAAGLCRRAT